MAGARNLLKLLDVACFPRRSENVTNDCRMRLGLIFPLFDIDLRVFLKEQPLKLAGMRHVLRSILTALASMHTLGLIHADVKPANILLRGAGVFQAPFRTMIGRETLLVAEADGPSKPRDPHPEDVALSYHLPATIEVVLADVGCALSASAACRCVVTNWPKLEVPIVTQEYRPPMCSWAVATLAPS